MPPRQPTDQHTGDGLLGLARPLEDGDEKHAREGGSHAKWQWQRAAGAVMLVWVGVWD